MSSPQQEKISQVLKGVIEPGETWIVRAIANDVLVEDYDVSRNADRKQFPAEVITRTEILNDSISSGGYNWIFVGIILVITACLGIHMEWFDNLLGPQVAKLKSVWVYAWAIIGSGALLLMLGSYWAKLAYLRDKDEWSRSLDSHGIDLAEFFTAIKDDPDLESLVAQLKADRQLLS